MKGIKNFDFFQKIAVDNVTQPTIFGSLLSLSAISLIIFLLIREIFDWLIPSTRTETIVYHDQDQKSKINVNLNIFFHNIPCHILSVDQEDSVGNHKMDISDTIEKTRLSQSSSKIGVHQRGPMTIEQVSKSITDLEGCLISGYIPISKVPGDIHISIITTLICLLILNHKDQIYSPSFQ